MDLILGIDFGTSSVKVTLLDKNLKECGSWSKKTNAYNNFCSSCDTNKQSAYNYQGQSLNPCLMNIHDEQNCIFILNSLCDCLLEIPVELRQRIYKIAVCGQMHGIVMWKQKPIFDIEHSKFLDQNNFSPLYTWQDKRCTQDFINSLPQPHSHLKLSSGFACATIAYFKRYDPNLLNSYNFCGSIMDLFVILITGMDKCAMSPQVAASWGYFDTAHSTWNHSLLVSIGFPIRMLPDIKQEGTILGECTQFFCGNKHDGSEIGFQRPKVFVALGDMQCSVLANLIDEKTAVINIGTSSQLSTIMPNEFHPSFYALEGYDNLVDNAVEYFPFFGQRYLKVAASMNGGNILELFVNKIFESIHEIGIDTKLDEIWAKLNKTCQSNQSVIFQTSDLVTKDILALKESNQTIETNNLPLCTDQNKKSIDNFAIITKLFTERHEGSFIINEESKKDERNIEFIPNSFFKDNNAPIIGSNIKDSFIQLCNRLVLNLCDIYGLNFINSKEIYNISCCGNALQQNIILKQVIVERFRKYGIQEFYWKFNEAAMGAALSLCPEYTKCFL